MVFGGTVFPCRDLGVVAVGGGGGRGCVWKRDCKKEILNWSEFL